MNEIEQKILEEDYKRAINKFEAMDVDIPSKKAILIQMDRNIKLANDRDREFYKISKLMDDIRNMTWNKAITATRDIPNDSPEYSEKVWNNFLRICKEDNIFGLYSLKLKRFIFPWHKNFPNAVLEAYAYQSNREGKSYITSQKVYTENCCEVTELSINKINDVKNICLTVIKKQGKKYGILLKSEHINNYLDVKEQIQK